ncbi:CLUMA_CG015543, isoform A [Clunio marinus]|uniref:CLUMA_CG015543, isoform A n=1 Tax=Clunio marinus TaxID=568069 RepID=A0A1J1IQ49_9DIPT|nr:CLUMA_CG015543, isoform A [Clunio marinus]
MTESKKESKEIDDTYKSSPLEGIFLEEFPHALIQKENKLNAPSTIPCDFEGKRLTFSLECYALLIYFLIF